MKRIFRHEVPADTNIYKYECGEILSVGALCRTAGLVEFWALSEPAEPKLFTVVGTGATAPEGIFRGTAIDAGGFFIWHLYEVSA